MTKTVGTLGKVLDSYLTTHLEGVDSAIRVKALGDYARGLGLEIRDKSMMAMARVVAPERVESCRQRMQRAVGRGRFDSSEIFHRLQSTVGELAASQVQALCVDDTGIAKQGSRSVGVQRQYSGTLGKIGNCQVVTTLHGISNSNSFCLGGRLYLPEAWVNDPSRRNQAGVPEDAPFLTKPQAALALIKDAIDHGFPKRPVLGDAAFGDSRDFRDGIVDLGLDFAVAISSKTMVWGPGVEPVIKPGHKLGRRPSRYIGSEGETPIAVSDLARELLDTNKFRKTTWRQGTKEPLNAQFARLRVRSAERCTKGLSPSAPMWLLMEINPQEKRPFKFYLSSLPETTPMKELVNLVKMRWRIEMDYRDMKQHLGLDQYEGRTWGGFHRHLAMVVLMQVFIALYKERFSPRSCETMELEPILPCLEASRPALVKQMSVL